MRSYYNLANSGEKLARAFTTGGITQQKAASKARSNFARDQKYLSDAALNQQRLQGMDQGQDMFMQGTTGLNQQQLDLMNAFTQNGQQWEEQAAGPPTPQGEYPTIQTESPEWYSPDVQDRYNTARATMGLNLAGTGDSNAKQIADAFQGMINIGRQDDVISGKANPADIAKAIGATEGEPMVDVTGSGIAFDRYGDKNDLNTQPFIENANIDAQAKVDSALARANTNGGQLPAEAKLVEYYMSKGEPYEKARELARSRKNVPIRQLAGELYMETRNNRSVMDPEFSQMPPEEQDRIIDDEVTRALRFITSKENMFNQSGGGNNNDPGGQGTDKPPVAGAKKAPDGNWYIQRNGQWHRVEQ